MLTKTILIDENLNERIKTSVKKESIKKALEKIGGYKNAGEGLLIRRALAAGLTIELRNLEEFVQE